MGQGRGARSKIKREELIKEWIVSVMCLCLVLMPVLVLVLGWPGYSTHWLVVVGLFGGLVARGCNSCGLQWLAR